MTNKQIIAVQRYMYRHQIAEIKELLKKMNLKPVTDIWIYPDYPTGWHAVVGIWDRLFIFTKHLGQKIQLSIEPAYGVRPNGTLIRK